MKLKPADGRAVRDPVKGTLLPATGDEVTLNAFWRRRLRDGDVDVVTLDQTGDGTTAETVTDTSTASTTTASTDASTDSTSTASTDASTDSTSEATS